MKKLLMFLCCVFAINNAWAARTCPRAVVQLQGLQNGNDNEFVFTTMGAYLEARECNAEGKKKGYECDLKRGALYECDTETGCTDGQYLFGLDGYVSAANYVNDKILQCSTSPDKWIQYTYSDCPASVDNGWTEITFQNTVQKKCYKKKNAGYAGGFFCCKSDLQSACEDDKYGIWNGQTCQCASADGILRTWNKKEYKCEVDNTQSQKKSCDRTSHGQTKTETCPSFILNGSLCKRTCNDGKWSDWALVSCKNPYLPKNGICVKPLIVGDSNGGGNGNNNGDSGNVNIGGDNAVQLPPVVEQPFSCPELTPSDWRTAYASCADVIAAYEALEEYCANEPNKNEFNSRRNALVSLRNACSDKQRRITESTAKISGLGDKLKDIMSAKLSVWKTAEGNFNGARLASDSIAGVVLGTAGGLITSTVVKKNQVKTGFEDVNCAVGGQNVAGWGDEFTVGIR